MSHDYRLTLRWDGDPTIGTASYATYSRQYRIEIDGKPPLAGSADPQFRGDPALHNPEELFVAAIASCHMLSYLALCARSGIRVTSYVDDAHGRLLTHEGGGGRIERVTLRPRVEVAEAAEVARAIELHREAHERCFIANSCSVPIDCDPVVTVRPRRQDLAVRLPHRPGELARFGETLGRAGISLEGGGGFLVTDACVVHFLVHDGERAATVLREAGFEVLGVREVVELRLAQEVPGQLGKLARAMADAGVNIECVYSDHDHQLVVCADDLDAARRVAADWQAARAAASR